MAEGPLGGPRPFGKGPLASEEGSRDTKYQESITQDIIENDRLQLGDLLNLYLYIADGANEATEFIKPIRDAIDDALRSIPISAANPNINPQTVAGAVAGLGLYAANDYAPVDFEAETEIAEEREVEEGTEYVVNVDAPFFSIAHFYSMYEAGTGLTSIFIDRYEITNIERIESRPIRDTYQVTMIERPFSAVEETGQDLESLIETIE